jgi:hypothetical protein
MIQKIKNSIQILCLMVYLDINFLAAKNMVKLYNEIKNDKQ